MNINQIRYFIAIVECGSFREAAEVLSLSQPALSNSIKTLEESVQVQLFERRKHGVVPTPYGKVLYEFFKVAVESVQRGYQEIELMREGSRGHINIGAPTGMIDLFLPQIIEQVSSKQSGITFSVRYGYLDYLLQSLRHGELDFLLTPYWPETLLSEDLEIEKLTDIFVSIYARASHPLTRKKEVTLEDLMAADWIFAQSEGMQSLREDLFGSENIRAVNCIITNDHPPFMIKILQRLDLLSLIPEYTVDELTKRGLLKKIEYPPFRPALSAGLIRLTGRHITPSMELFVETTREFLKDASS